MVFLMWYMINRHGIHTVAYNKMKILWTHEINLGNVQNHTLYTILGVDTNTRIQSFSGISKFAT